MVQKLSFADRSSYRTHYKLNLERSTIIVLCLLIVIFILFPYFTPRKNENHKTIVTTIVAEDIPVTRHGAYRKPPPKPAIPIPSEDALFPQDVTIEETEIRYDLPSPQIGTGLPGQMAVFQPRPIFEVIPEYPEEVQKKGIQGLVKLHIHINEAGLVDEVVILENTTSSSVCADAAKEAALKGRYIPAKKSGQPTDLWITRTYTFGIQK